jgi:heme-degrading monooxygenase HmoA
VRHGARGSYDARVVTVIFRSRLREENEAEYAELAPRMLELARSMPGFVSFERFTADDGERLALIAFESLEDVAAWREHPEHRAAQQLGRERFYSEYNITVAEQVRAYSFDGERRTTQI